MSEEPTLLTRTIRLADVRHGPVRVVIEPDSATLAAIAAAWSLPSIRAVRADLTVSATDDGAGLVVMGTLTADLVQTCVVTLDDVPARIESGILRTYLPPHMIEEPEDFDEDGNLILNLDEEDPEPLHDGTADLGALVLEELSLNLDPFPRAPGVEFSDVIEDAEGPEVHPFAGLAALRKKTDGE